MTGTTEARPTRFVRSARSERPGPGEHDHHSVGELVGQATEQLSLLVRQEIALAKEELTEKGRRAGRGGGLLGAAGAVAYVGFMTLAAAAVGRAQLRQATPPRPEQALDSVKADMDEIKGRARR